MGLLHHFSTIHSFPSSRNNYYVYLHHKLIVFTGITTMSSFTAPTTPSPPTDWDFIADASKLVIMQDLFNLTSDHPDYDSINKVKSIINQLVSTKYRFVTMLSGPNAGERRQIHTDVNNAKYYEHNGRKYYVTNWINAKKQEMGPSASPGIVAQYNNSNNPTGIAPVNLFADPDPPVSHK